MMYFFNSYCTKAFRTTALKVLSLICSFDKIYYLRSYLLLNLLNFKENNLINIFSKLQVVVHAKGKGALN